MLVESSGKGLAVDRVQLARTDPLERLEQALSVAIDTSFDVQNTECVCVANPEEKCRKSPDAACLWYVRMEMEYIVRYNCALHLRLVDELSPVSGSRLEA